MIPIDPKRYAGHGDLLQSQLVQADIMGKEIEPIRNIYFDLQCLRDIRLGALLTFIHDKGSAEEYQYMLTQVSQYNARVDREVMTYFPKLPYTEADLDMRIADPTYTDKIVILAPTTGCYENLHKILYVIKRRNDHTDKSIPVRVVINLHPFKVTDFLKDMFTKVIQSICPTYKVAFMEKPLKHINPQSLMGVEGDKLTFRIFFIWDVFDSFLGEDSSLKILYTEDMKFQDIQIYAAKLLQVPASVVKDELDNALQNLETLYAYLNICSLFEYMDFTLFTPNPAKE